MLTVDDYLDIAKKNMGTNSDRKLAIKVGISQGVLSGWRTKRLWPSENAMIRLARVGGLDAEVALIHLEAWRTDGEARDMFLSIAQKLSNYKSQNTMSQSNNISNNGNNSNNGIISQNVNGNNIIVNGHSR